MHRGFIKLHRKMEDWEWFDDHELVGIFVKLIMWANYKDKKWHGIIIPRGSFVTSLPKLSERLKISVQRVRTALNKLKLTCELTVKPTSKYSMISITNYDIYQDISITQQTDQQTSNTGVNRRATRELTDEQQQLKKVKKLKENKELKNSPSLLKVLENIELQLGRRYQNKELCQAINARLKENHSPELLIKVWNHMFAKWNCDLKMRSYLWSETVFRPSKFEKYLEEIDDNVVEIKKQTVEERIAKSDKYWG